MDAAIIYPDLAFPYYKRFCREHKGSKYGCGVVCVLRKNSKLYIFSTLVSSIVSELRSRGNQIETTYLYILQRHDFIVMDNQ